MRIENWSLADTSYDPYKAPEQLRPRLAGKVYSHPRFADGEDVITSPIVGVEGDKVRTLSGSLYELGEVDPSYEKVFPGARDRVLKGGSR